jgi:hypothetical protein
MARNIHRRIVIAAARHAGPKGRGMGGDRQFLRQ